MTVTPLHKGDRISSEIQGDFMCDSLSLASLDSSLRERLKACCGAYRMVVSVWGLMRTMPLRSEMVTYGVPPVRK